MCLGAYFVVCVRLLTYALSCPISGHFLQQDTILETRHKGART